MGTRTARLGFVGYALSLGLAIGLGLWNEHLWGRMRDGSNDVDVQLKILSAGYIALELLAIASLLAISRLPPAVRVRKLVLAATALAATGFVIGLGQRFTVELRGYSPQLMEKLMRAVNYADALIYAACEILLALAAMRIARAASSEWVRALAIAAVVSRAVVALLRFLPFAAGDWIYWVHRGSNVLLAVLCAALAAVVTRIGDTVPAVGAAGSDGRLSDEWRAPADGIALYLGAGGARVLCALFGWLAMSGARGAQAVSELREVRVEVLFVAALSAAATVTMLFALWRIARAPFETRASGPATIALVLAGLGLLLDGWSTSITADALDGNLSAAFFAMKALPAIAGVSSLLGVAIAASLLRAFENLATALERSDLAARARNATWLLVGGGILVGFGFGLLTKATELLLVILIVALPLTIAGVVQLLRVAFGVLRAIRVRLV